MASEDFAIRRLTVNIGAEVLGANLAEPLPSDVRVAIRNALLDHQVLFFPDQSLDSAQHLAFAGQFGEITPAWPVMLGATGATREIASFDSAAPGTKAGTERWHADITYVAEPPAVSFLNIVSMPEVGGDTMFASCEAAYESLSTPLQQLCDGLWAVHDSRGSGTSGLVDYLAESGEGEWNGQRVAN